MWYVCAMFYVLYVEPSCVVPGIEDHVLCLRLYVLCVCKVLCVVCEAFMCSTWHRGPCDEFCVVCVVSEALCVMCVQGFMCCM